LSAPAARLYSLDDLTAEIVRKPLRFELAGSYSAGPWRVPGDR
jgi:hypothetical protein